MACQANSHDVTQRLHKVLGALEYPGLKFPGLQSLTFPKDNEFKVVVDGKEFAVKVEPR